MSKHMKYVVHNGPLNDEIYLFPNFIQHNDFVSRMSFRCEDILSAGFVTPDMVCYGRSVSLGISSNSEIDTCLLDKSFGFTLENTE